MRRALAVLAAALAAAPAALAQGNPIVDAFAKTSTQHSERFALTETVQTGAATVPITATGAIDSTAMLSSMQMDLSKVAPGGLGTPADWRVQAIVDSGAGVVYLKFPLLQQLAHTTKPWLRIDLAKLAGGRGVDVGALLQLARSPLDQIAMLRATTGNVTKIGAASVRGVATTHYRATIDYRKYAQIAPAPAPARASVRALVAQLRTPLVPIDVYVDGQGLIRRVVMVEPLKTGTSSLRFDFLDFGAPAGLHVPPAAQVFDANGLLARAAKGG